MLSQQPISAADIRSACLVYAGRVLHTADPTRQGAIAVDVIGLDRATAVGATGEAYLTDRDVSCVATASAGQFNGTLVGIGDGPLPLVR